METAIQQVRSRLLQLVSQQDGELFDSQDLDSHVRTRDAFIRMFCTHYHELHDREEYDIESISQKMLATLKWRKASGLTSMTAADIPKEFWNEVRMYEDDEYLIYVYTATRHRNVSKRWSDQTIRFTQYMQNRFCLEAQHAGKKTITVTDARGMAMSNVDRYSFEKGTQLMDEHFPCLFHKMGMIGMPGILAPIANAFIRYSLPGVVWKMFKSYNTNTIRELFDDHHLPDIFGGNLKLNTPPLEESERLPSLKEKAKDWGLEERAIQQLIEFYGPTSN